MIKRDVLVHIDDLEKETEKAYQVSIDHETFWLPKSHTKMQTLKHRETGEIKRRRVIVPYWLAERTGFLAKAHNGMDMYVHQLVDPE